MSEDGNEATIVETFVDSDERVENLWLPNIPGMDKDSTNKLGSVRKVKKEIDLLSPMGAKFQGYVGGFNQINKSSQRL